MAVASLSGSPLGLVRPGAGTRHNRLSGAGPLELDAVLDMKLNKMMQDITLLRRLWVLILFITVILCPYMAWIVSRTWLSP